MRGSETRAGSDARVGNDVQVGSDVQVGALACGKGRWRTTEILVARDNAWVLSFYWFLWHWDPMKGIIQIVCLGLFFE